MLVERRANVHASCYDDAHVLPTNQEPFLITVSRVQSMRSFFNVVFRGRPRYVDVSWLLATPILIREIRLHATYHNCSSPMLLWERTTQSIHLQCDTAKNEKPPSLCTVDSVYMDTDVTKNRSGLTKTMVYRYRMLVSWK